jgi:hypothetical protein
MSFDHNLRSLALISAFAAAAPAQTLLRSVPGPAANANYGGALLAVPDQNSDGYDDLLVGAPGFNQQRGAIYCLSGAYLAFGSGTQTLWSLAPSANPGDLFGTAIADVGDANADGIRDFLVGQPGYDTSTIADCGAVCLVSGSTHSIVARTYGLDIGIMLGASIAPMADFNSDGLNEVAVGAPGPLAARNSFHLLLGSKLAIGGTVTSVELSAFFTTTNTGFASSLAAFSFGPSSSLQLAVGEPGYDAPNAVDAGRCCFFGFIFGAPSDS